MDEDLQLGHTTVRVPIVETFAHTLEALGGFLVLFGILGLIVSGLFWTSIGGLVSAVVLAAGILSSILAGMNWYATHVELHFYPARIEVRRGRRCFTLQPALDTLQLRSSAGHQKVTLVAAQHGPKGRRLEIDVRLLLEEEKRLWRYIDEATRSARSRTGLADREVPASLQRARQKETSR